MVELRDFFSFLWSLSYSSLLLRSSLSLGKLETLKGLNERLNDVCAPCNEGHQWVQSEYDDGWVRWSRPSAKCLKRQTEPQTHI